MENEIVEFKVVKGDSYIGGYMYLEDADSEEALHFYDSHGFEAGFHVPKNPWPEHTEGWDNYETLSSEFQSDDLFIQFLVDFAKENKTIDRGEYILIINEGDD